MRRVEIDLNVRTRGSWTFAGIEDADGPVAVGDEVTVFESETGISGPGRVEIVDLERRLIFLSVDWGSLAAPRQSIASRLGAFMSITRGEGVAADPYESRNPVLASPVAGIAFAA